MHQALARTPEDRRVPVTPPAGPSPEVRLDHAGGRFRASAPRQAESSAERFGREPSAAVQLSARSTGVPPAGVNAMFVREGMEMGLPGDVHEVAANQFASAHARSVATRSSADVRGSGASPLDPGSRRVLESGLGQDLSAVRLHTGPSAAASAHAVGARAYTVGNDIVFGARQHAPATARGAHLLAHEVAHVVQQRAAPAPSLQREGEGTPGHMEFGTTLPPEIQSRYPGLIDALSAPQLNALEIAFTRLELQADVATAAAPEVQIPVTALLTSPARYVDRDIWDVLCGLLMRHASPQLVGDLVRNEIMRQFFSENGLTLESTVAIRPVRLIGPEAGTALEYRLDGRSITDTDGAITPSDLDSLGGTSLQTVIGNVTSRATAVGNAAALILNVDDQSRTITSIHDRSRGSGGDTNFTSFSLRELRARAASLRDCKRQSENLGNAPSQAAGLAARYEALIPRMDTLVSEGTVWQAAHNPAPTDQEQYDEAGTAAVGYGMHNWDQGNYVRGALGYTGGAVVAVFDGLGNLLSFGYQRAEGESTVAYRRGDISYDAMREFQTWAAVRSVVVGAVTIGLIIATAGLGAAAAGGLGLAEGGFAAAAFGGGLEASMATAGTMTTESLFTRAADMSDPTMQALWRQSAHTPGQIAFGSTVAFGMGAGGGALGRWYRGAPVTALAPRMVASGEQTVVIGEFTITVEGGIGVGTHATDGSLVFFARPGGAGFYQIVAGGELVPLREIGRGGVNIVREAQALLLTDGTQAASSQSTALVRVASGELVPIPTVGAGEGGSLLLGSGGGSTVLGGAPAALPAAPTGALPRLTTTASGLAPPAFTAASIPPEVVATLPVGSMIIPPPIAGARPTLVLPPAPPPITGGDVVRDWLAHSPAGAAAPIDDAAITDLVRRHTATLPPPPPVDFSTSLGLQPFGTGLQPFGATDPMAPFRPFDLSPRPTTPLSLVLDPLAATTPRIRTLSPTGDTLGWGGFNITESQAWQPARMTPWDRQVMAEVRGRLTGVQGLDPRVWAAAGPNPLTGRQLQRAVRDAVRETAQALGIPGSRIPTVEFQSLGPGSYGWADWQFNRLANGRLLPTAPRGTIVISDGLQVGDAVATAVHETRHIFQSFQAYEASIGRTAHPATAIWSPNLPQVQQPGGAFGTYFQSPDPRYFTQPIERDAESFGRRTVDLLPAPSRWPP